MLDNASVAVSSLEWAGNILKEGKYAASRKITEASSKQKFSLAQEWAQVNHEFSLLEEGLRSLLIRVEKLSDQGG